MKMFEESFVDVVREMCDFKYSFMVLVMRWNLLGEELRILLFVEVVGWERGGVKRVKGEVFFKKFVMKRLGSRRSNKEMRFGLLLDGKGKGKEVVYILGDEVEDSFIKKGSFF